VSVRVSERVSGWVDVFQSLYPLLSPWVWVSESLPHPHAAPPAGPLFLTPPPSFPLTPFPPLPQVGCAMLPLDGLPPDGGEVEEWCTLHRPSGVAAWTDALLRPQAQRDTDRGGERGEGGEGVGVGGRKKEMEREHGLQTISRSGCRMPCWPDSYPRPQAA
jgi:hypothetical protein